MSKLKYKLIRKNPEVKKEDNVNGYCLEMFDASSCTGCLFFHTETVGHPGGSSVHQVEKCKCTAGFWEYDF